MPDQPSEYVSVLAPAVLRRFFVAFLGAALVFSCIVAGIYRQDIRHQRVLFEQEAQHVLALQQEVLSFELRAVQADLLFLAAQDSLLHFWAGDPSARVSLEREYLNFARNKEVYDQIRCLDTSGQEIVRVNYRAGRAEIVSQDDLQSKATRDYYQQALSLERGEYFVSPFDLNVEHGQIEHPVQPVIRFLTPVFDESGQKRGLLVLNYLGAHLLSKLKQISVGFRGETMLINPAGEYLQAPDPSHEWGWLLDHTHNFRNDFPDVWDLGKHLEPGQIVERQNLFLFRRALPQGLPSIHPPLTDEGSEQTPSALILASFVSPSVANAHSRELLTQLMFLFVGVMAVFAILSFYWAWSGEVRKYHVRRIAESESRLRQLSSLLLAAQETERRNLSRDLHDDLGQSVTAISLDLRSIEKKECGKPCNPLLRRAIDETDKLLTSLHEIATRIRPSVLDDLGLPDAVESLLSEYQLRTGIAVRSELCFRREEIPANVGENAYRILQEALANVATHARVDMVEVTMETDDNSLRVTICDSGIGFDPGNEKNSTRLGILGMRERVELLHGQFSLQSTLDDGTKIIVSIPLG